MAEDHAQGTESPDLKIGSYRLLQPLGAGGISSVYRAVHIESGHEVAVKILPRSLAKNPSMLQRFLREAKSAESLEHPNIVTIFDRGVDQGRYYLVLEFVAGGDLHDRVRHDGPLEVDEAVAIVRSVAEGLKFAVERGLIHRDIKPANLLVSPEGLVKIIDLGLALKAEVEDERVTRDGTTVGTVDYMSPEQARDSRATSERSDIYSLGCTFYYLLTGAPPFAGGDIADKLNRHCTQPAPYAHEARPDVPAYLGKLIRKMMAKRPENRFQNYNELLAALKAVPSPGTTAPSSAESDDGIPLAPVESGIAGTLAAGKAHGGVTGSSQGSPFDLAELADDEEAEAPAPARPRPAATPHTPKARPRPNEPRRDRDANEHGAETDLDADAEGLDLGDAGEGIDDDEMVEGLAVNRPAPARAPMNPSTLKWVYRALGGSVAVLLLIVIVTSLLPKPNPAAPSGSVESIEAPVPPEAAPIAAAPAEVTAPAPAAVPAAKPEPAPPIAIATAEQAAPPAARGVPAAPPPAPVTAAPAPGTTAAAPAWVEPADPTPQRPAEVPIAADIEARFPLPAWAKAPIPERVAGNYIKVRRINDPSTPTEKPSVSSSLEQIGNGTTELIDDGPFIESDLRLHGDVRLVRALKGRRPIIRLDRPRLEVVKDQQAFFFLEGKHLILDGIDLIVDLQDLPREHTSLFYCKGGALTLHDCTITVVNPQSHPFALIRAVGGDRAQAQVRIEDSFIRGTSMAAIEFSGGGAEVAVIRSILVEGKGPAIASTGLTPAGDRKLHLYRSLLASRGPVLELSTATGAKPAPIAVRALATTFTRFRSDEQLSVISFHDDVALEVKELVNWQGESNTFTGWNDWSALGNAHLVKVASLAAARTTWPGTDAQSQESPTPWPVAPDCSRVLPEQMLRLDKLAPQAVATLHSTAWPSPFLFEKTIDEFKRPEPPGYVSPIPNVVVDTEGFAGNPSAVPPPFTPSPNFGAPPPGVPGAPADPNAPPAIVVKELLFDIAAKPMAGNLGLFLREQVKAGDARVKVKVSGTGRSLPFTPVALPVGTSLEIIVETTRATGGVPPEWTPIPGATGDALLATKGGDLVLTGVELVRDPAARLKALLKVEEGHLVVNHCRLKTDPRLGRPQPQGGGLIVFRAPTSRPLPSRPWPFESAIDRPVCRIIDSALISTGDVITADLARGMVALTECAVAAGGSAFALNPQKVARKSFDCDLWIERSTVAAEKNFVLLGGWPGSAPGPDRPWLVTSRDSAYMSSYQPPSRESVLLRVEPNSLAQGALFWQGNNDAYEVINFTGRFDKSLAPNTHPDVYRHWTSMWGSNHFRNPTGPVRGGGGSVKLLARLHARQRQRW